MISELWIRPIIKSIPWLNPRLAVLVTAWVMALTVAYFRLDHAINSFNEAERPTYEFYRWLLRHRTDDPERVTQPQDENTPRIVGPRRTAGNNGHAQIDFGGQYLMGRMIVEGYGQELYNRNRHWQVLNGTFRSEYEAANTDTQQSSFWSSFTDQNTSRPNSDAANLMAWTLGHDDNLLRQEWSDRVGILFASGSDMYSLSACAYLTAYDHDVGDLKEKLNKPVLGGALYPPVQAILYAPLCMFEPRVTYVLFQYLSVLSMFIAGCAAMYMTNGRIWTPLATTILLLYPGCRPGLDLAQNQSITIAILFVGWGLMCRNRPILGGIVWGLLAFKPVWAISFGLVPLLLFNFRFVLGMGLSAGVLCLISLPFVGVHSWKDWLANGKEATNTYNTCKNWINLSRDLSGIVRRQTNDMNSSVDTFDNTPDLDLGSWRKLFDPKYVSVPHTTKASVYSWILLFAVLGLTLFVYFGWGTAKHPLGLSTGFLMLGCYLCCFRFMYYDSLLSSLCIFVIIAIPRWFIHFPGAFSSKSTRLPSEESDEDETESTSTTLTQPESNQTTIMIVIKSFYISILFPLVSFMLINDNKLISEGVTSYNDPVETYCLMIIWFLSGLMLISRCDRPEDLIPT